METIVSSLPGYRVYEYALVLSPHAELRHRLRTLKRDFATAYRLDNPSPGHPYLVLVRFTQYALAEERICQRLNLIGMAFPPFKVELKDFGSFPSHTIYINVLSRLPVQKLVKTIRSEAQRLLKMDEEHKPQFVLEPHITLAARLKPWQYEKGWLEYGHRHFSARFLADGMQLLRRQPGEKRYQPVAAFAFRHLPVTTKQGELF